MCPANAGATECAIHVIRDSTGSKYNGRRFEIDPDRTVIAIDLDDCVIQTNYRVAIFNRFDTISQPCEHARDTIESLAKDYQIIYISARPWFWYPGTRSWLEAHEFPPAPIVHSTHLWYLVAQHSFKRVLMKELRERIPNLLIGIGDRSTDIDGFRSAKMLCINVNPKPRGNTGHDAVFVSDWLGVARIFRENRETMTKPEGVRAVMRGDVLLKLPLFKYPGPADKSADRQLADSDN